MYAQREQRATGRVLAIVDAAEALMNNAVACVLFVPDHLGGHCFKHPFFSLLILDIVW